MKKIAALLATVALGAAGFTAAPALNSNLQAAALATPGCGVGASGGQFWSMCYAMSPVRWHWATARVYFYSGYSSVKSSPRRGLLQWSNSYDYSSQGYVSDGPWLHVIYR